MKKRNIIIAVVAVAIVAVGIGLFVQFNNELKLANGKNIVIDETKNITLTISADGKAETYEIETNAENLGTMLVDEGYVKNDRSTYGLYIQTVYGPFEDGRTADSSKEEWWNLVADGEALLAGADQTPISDGAKYELSLVVGYDNF